MHLPQQRVHMIVSLVLAKIYISFSDTSLYLHQHNVNSLSPVSIGWKRYLALDLCTPRISTHYYNCLSVIFPSVCLFHASVVSFSTLPISSLCCVYIFYSTRSCTLTVTILRCRFTDRHHWRPHCPLTRSMPYARLTNFMSAHPPSFLPFTGLTQVPLLIN